jgi:hypothetical protein
MVFGIIGHGEMHSTSKGSSLSGRCSGLPRVWRPVWLPRLFPVLLVPFVLVPVLLIVREYERR